MSSLTDLAFLIGPEVLVEATAVYAYWTDLVARIRLGQTDGLEELYHLFSRGIRLYLANQLGPDEVEGRVHDTLVAVVQAIRRDELKDPERLMGFVHAIVRRQAAAQGTTESVVSSELRQENPEEAAAFHRKTELIDRVLAATSQRERDVLTRYYLQGQSQDQIRRELGLTETQFRLLMSSAKVQFGEMQRRLLSHPERNRLRDEVDPTRRSEAGELSTGAPETDAYVVREYEAPQTAVEKVLAGIWAEVLQRERVGRHDDFFELGGHSLSAVQLIARMEQALGAHVGLRALFERPVLSDFARGLHIAATGTLPSIKPAKRSARMNLKRIVPVVAHAVAVFGDEKKASHWLATPLPILGDRSPSQLLEGQEGIELVEQVLTRIEHNIPS